jgi:ACR3 family arsenite efflux pump ArsB
MTASWAMIIVINLSLILLVMFIKHKETIIKKPSRVIRKKVPIKSPTVNKPVRKIIKK